MARKFITLAVLSATVALAACNTVRGVGRDVESAGKTVENASH